MRNGVVYSILTDNLHLNDVLRTALLQFTNSLLILSLSLSLSQVPLFSLSMKTHLVFIALCNCNIFSLEMRRANIS